MLLCRAVDLTSGRDILQGPFIQHLFSAAADEHRRRHHVTPHAHRSITRRGRRRENRYPQQRRPRARRGRGPGSAAPEGLATGAAPGTAAVQEDFGEAGPCCHRTCKEGAAREGARDGEVALDAACPCPDAASTFEAPSAPGDHAVDATTR